MVQASTAVTLRAVQEAGEDFEWYPTTKRMIDAITSDYRLADVKAIMDIGAGDGRVLAWLAAACKDDPKLYAIEKSPTLVQAQPESVIPVGTDLYEQNLSCLPVDVIFCNPPYSQFETWTSIVIESGYANRAYLVIPCRWKDSAKIAASLAKRGAKANVIHSDDFNDADRRARAVVDVVEIRYPKSERGYGEPQDPFDAWFDQNISTFDVEEEPADPSVGSDLSKQHKHDSIASMVAAFDEEYARMEENYRAIFKLDYAILKELGVSKDNVREGIKKRMAGLKAKYWKMLFDELGSLTSRLSTATKRSFLDKLNDQRSVAFTASNAYAIVLWAIKHANKYFDEQLVKLFKDLSTFDGVLNYKSNTRTWQQDKWRFRDDASHYSLDYRIVVEGWRGIDIDWNGKAREGRLRDAGYDLVADIIAVLSNLGFACDRDAPSPRSRYWSSGSWEDFANAAGDVLFQAKPFRNGNMHLRFKPEAIKALNVEAGRLMGWIRGPSDVVAELGYTPAEAEQYFNTSRKILPGSVKLLTAGAA